MTRRRKKSRRILPKVFMLAILLAGAFILWSFSSANNVGAAQARREIAPSEQTVPDRIVPPSGFPGFTTQIFVADIVDTQYLKLVNRELGISTPVNYARLVAAWPDVPVRATYITVHETALDAIRELFTAAYYANIRNLFITSGFRSYEKQRELYQNAADRRYVMSPGHSEHQMGLGVDILFSGSYSFGGMAGTPEAAWLAQNAPQFGLILRYPYDKQDVTGVAYEPWHFRYVGRVHAYIMAQYGFVLEEYIDFLQRNVSYQAAFDGKTWYILYQRPENGMIFVPHDMDFNVSSANTGGYIVTAWR